MGYAMFAHRETMLVSQINNMEFIMTTLMMQMQSLANQSAIVADGVITSDEKRSIFDFNTLKGLNAIEQNGFARGIAKQQVYEKIKNAQGQVIEKRMTTLSEEYKEEIRNRVQQAEKNIEFQIKRIDTQLSAKRKELESVTRAKENGIKNATPKFGLA